MASSGNLKHRPDSQQAKTAPVVETSKADLKFIAFCRDLGWGKIELLIKDGRPTMATIVRRDFRFDV